MDNTDTTTYDENLSDDGKTVTWPIMSDTTTGTVSGDGVASAPTTGGYAMRPLTPKERNLEAARRHAGKATTATEEHKTRLYHLGHVFGHSVRGAASEHIEDLDDNQSEAFRHYEQAIRTGDQERADLQAEITALRGVVERLNREIESEKAFRQNIISRAKYWFARKKMNHPVWLKDAIEVAAERERF